MLRAAPALSCTSTTSFDALECEGDGGVLWSGPVQAADMQITETAAADAKCTC